MKLRSDCDSGSGTITGKFQHTNYAFQTANLNNRIDFIENTGHHHKKYIHAQTHTHTHTHTHI